MSRWVLTPVALIVLGGCAAPPPTEPVEAPQPIVAKEIPISSSQSGASNVTVGLRDEQDEWLLIGSQQDTVDNHFKLPAGAKKVEDVPPSLKKEQFRAWGWEDAKTGTSFGALVEKRSGHVVLAMLTKQKQSATDLTDLIMVYGAKLDQALDQPEKVGGQTDAVQYLFWQKDDSPRTMICAVTNKSGGYTVTIAAGLPEVMDAIGAGKKQAETDHKAALKLLENTKKPG